MDEELSALDQSTRAQKVKDFFVKFKKRIFSLFGVILFITFGYFVYVDLQKKNKIKIADMYNQITTNYYSGIEKNIEKQMIQIIKEKDKTYSPLSLYFLLENEIIKDSDKINELFDVLINEINVEKEIKNLIIYKKAMYNTGIVSENELLDILNPILKSESVWKSHALLLMADYFEHNNNLVKSKDFLEEIANTELVNNEIRVEAERRLKRKFSD